MKTFYSAVCLALIAAVVVAFTSCQKTIDASQNVVQAENQQSNFMGCNNCLVTHYEDNYLGITANVFYNNRRQADSVQTILLGDTLTSVASYDKFGRLNKIHFPLSTVQDYEMYKYGGAFLPAKMLYIVPNYKDYGKKDSINAEVDFTYNSKGEMIQMKQMNFWYWQNAITRKYNYNKQGNVTSITYISESGSSYTEYVFDSYDNKPNFMTGSIWLRYIFLYTYFQDPFYQLLFSNNNAKNWTWYNAFQIYGADEIVTSTFDYNKEGFANTVNLNVVDTVLGNYNNTRSALSTCDNSAIVQNQISSGTSIIRLNALKQLNNRPPSPFYNRKIVNKKSK